MPKSGQLADKQFPRLQGIVREVVGGFTVTVWLASSDDSIEALTLITDEPSASADAAINLVKKLARDRGISGNRIDLRVRLTTGVAAGGEELRMVGKEMIGDFEVEVFEDTYITAVHCKYGHKYSARWSTEVPHLRNEHCAPNDLAERDYKDFEDEAEQAMLRKLENDGLI